MFGNSFGLLLFRFVTCHLGALSSETSRNSVGLPRNRVFTSSILGTFHLVVPSRASAVKTPNVFTALATWSNNLCDTGIFHVFFILLYLSVDLNFLVSLVALTCVKQILFPSLVDVFTFLCLCWGSVQCKRPSLAPRTHSALGWLAQEPLMYWTNVPVVSRGSMQSQRVVSNAGFCVLPSDKKLESPVPRSPLRLKKIHVFRTSSLFWFDDF